MSKREKFLFDTSFDAERSERAKAAAAAQAAAAEPPAPTFSEEELAAARQAGFAEGRSAGLAEAEASQAKRLAVALEAMPQLFDRLAQDFAEEADERSRETLDAALTVVRKLFPELARASGLDEIVAVVAVCLERLRDEPRLVVRCADEDLDPLREKIEQCVARSGFEGKLVFLADERLAPGDLRVEWADGGAERDQAALWKEIDTVIARALSPVAKSEAPPKAAPAGTPAEARKATREQPAPKRAAAQTPHSDDPGAVQPLRRAQIA
jgi:flagellar assembly protein FliH